MKELLAYTGFIKKIIDTYHQKETVFYNDGEWYSRYHSRNISIEELTDWVLEIIEPVIYDFD